MLVVWAGKASHTRTRGRRGPANSGPAKHGSSRSDRIEGIRIGPSVVVCQMVFSFFLCRCRDAMNELGELESND